MRRARASDVAALAALRYEFRAGLGAATEERSAFLSRVSSWMLPRLSPENAAGCSWLCWVSETRIEIDAGLEGGGQRIVGNVWLQLLEKIPNPLAETEWHGYVSNFFVAEAARGRGVGSALLAELLAEARRRALDRVVLWPTARSRPLYERHGFTRPEALLELSLR